MSERKRVREEGQNSRTLPNAHSKNENLTFQKLWKYVTGIDKIHDQNGYHTKIFKDFFFFGRAMFHTDEDGID